MADAAQFKWGARNGRIVPVAELTIPAGSLAMRYALSAFEGVRGYLQADGKTVRFFALDEHLERLAATSKIMRLPEPPAAMLADTAHQLLAANQAAVDCYLRISASAVSLGTLKEEKAAEIAYDMTLQPMGRKPFAKGLSLAISARSKPGDQIFPQRAKVISNYAGPRLAYLDARDAGYDDVLMITADGCLSEAPTANLFLVRGGKVRTPRACDAILLGVTRRHMLELCRKAGVPALECALLPEDAYDADEAFLTGTGLELAPIDSFDGKPLRGPRSIFPRLREFYFAMVRNQSANGDHR